MLTRHNPPHIAPADSEYSQGVEAPAARTLYISGQTGVLPDGRSAGGIEEQCEWAWKNLIAVLESAGMSLANVAATTIYLTHPKYIETFRKVRAHVLGDLRPTSTLVVVSALVEPDWFVEIEATAIRP